jgi:molybdopterin converting factor small subunit
MAVQVQISGMHRNLTDGRSTVFAEGSTVAEIMRSIDSDFPAFGKILRGNDGSMAPTIRVFINGEDIAGLQGLETPVGEDDSVYVLAAIAGG